MLRRGQRHELIRFLRSRCDAMRSEIDRLVARRQQLELEQSREEHPCPCVALNRDIGVYDMGEQKARGRVGLELGGLVSETLSALRDCAVCNGTGVPLRITEPEQQSEDDRFLQLVSAAAEVLRLSETSVSLFDRLASEEKEQEGPDSIPRFGTHTEELESALFVLDQRICAALAHRDELDRKLVEAKALADRARLVWKTWAPKGDDENWDRCRAALDAPPPEAKP